MSFWEKGQIKVGCVDKGTEKNDFVLYFSIVGGVRVKSCYAGGLGDK